MFELRQGKARWPMAGTQTFKNLKVQLKKAKKGNKLVSEVYAVFIDGGEEYIWRYLPERDCLEPAELDEIVEGI